MSLNHKYIKSELPEELSRNVVVLTCDSTAEGGKCDIYLVGTNHLLEKSAVQVKAIINHLKPQVVFLELCEARARLLTHELAPQDFEVTIMDGIFKFDNLRQFLGCYSFGVYAKKLNIVPGSEFRAAYQEAKKYGAKVILGDRPMHVTYKRGWGRMSLWHKTKWFSSFVRWLFLLERVLTPEILKEMIGRDDDDETAQAQGMEFPALWKAHINERDQYMSSGLLEVASRHSSVVVVVGRAHLSGIEQYWKKPIVIDDLLKLP